MLSENITLLLDIIDLKTGLKLKESYSIIPDIKVWIHSSIYSSDGIVVNTVFGFINWQQILYWNYNTIDTGIELCTRRVLCNNKCFYLKMFNYIFFFTKTWSFKTPLYTKVHFLNVLIYRCPKTWDNNIYKYYTVGGLRLGERIETDDQRPQSLRAYVHPVVRTL